MTHSMINNIAGNTDYLNNSENFREISLTIARMTKSFEAISKHELALLGLTIRQDIKGIIDLADKQDEEVTLEDIEVMTQWLARQKSSDQQDSTSPN